MTEIKNDPILVCCILDFGQGSKALHVAKDVGALGETVFLGRGTVKDKFLNLLGATDKRKEILVAFTSKAIEDNLYETLRTKFHLEKPGHGIVFSMPVSSLSFNDDTELWSVGEAKGAIVVAYEAIFVIVNKGQSVEVLEAAESAGSTGGTVIHGRGSGTQEKAKLFNIEIEPEKDIVLILSNREQTGVITEAIERRLHINKPGAGILFVMGVTRTLGLYEG